MGACVVFGAGSRTAIPCQGVIPVSQYPSLKAKKVMSLLLGLGYRVTRTNGSHRKLECENRLAIGFAFHDRATVPPRALRGMLIDRARLTEKELVDLLWNGKAPGGGKSHA